MTTDLTSIPRRHDECEAVLERCYGDIKWLRYDMEANGAIVPPIVPKPFIRRHPNMRMSNIIRFLRRISGCPRLRRHPAFRAFLNPLVDLSKKKKGARTSFLASHSLKGQTKETMDPELYDVNICKYFVLKTRLFTTSTGGASLLSGH